MKKILSVVLAMVMTFSVFAILATAEDTLMISIETDVTSAKIGDIVTVKVVTTPDSGIVSTIIDLIYDAESFEVVDGSLEDLGAVGAGVLNAEFAPGTIRYAGASTSGATKTDIFTAQFKVVKTGGEFSLSFDEVYVADGDKEKDVMESVAAKVTPVTIECAHATEEVNITKEANCTEDGTKEISCTECGEVIRTEVIPATGHTEGDWEVIKGATETENGEKVKKCTVCGEIIATEEIPFAKLGDVNGDGKIMALDVRLVLKHSAEIVILDDNQFKRADVNKDGKVNSLDARWLLQVIAQLRVLED